MHTCSWVVIAVPVGHTGLSQQRDGFKGMFVGVSMKPPWPISFLPSCWGGRLGLFSLPQQVHCAAGQDEQGRAPPAELGEKGRGVAGGLGAQREAWAWTPQAAEAAPALQFQDRMQA